MRFLPPLISTTLHQAITIEEREPEGGVLKYNAVFLNFLLIFKIYFLWDGNLKNSKSSQNALWIL